MSVPFTLRDWIKQQRAKGWSTSDLADALYNALAAVNDNAEDDEEGEQ